MFEGKDGQRVYTTEEITGEACFAYQYARAFDPEKPEKDLERLQDLGAFIVKFKATFKGSPQEVPRARWLPAINRGLRELADLGIIELGRTAEGGWDVLKVHRDRLISATVRR
jgi:hypothetical protein